jgi:hypothetical protein
MKKLLIGLLFLISCQFVFSQSINFDNFDNEKLNQRTFCVLNTYNNYSGIDSFPEGEKIYRFIEKNCNKLSTDSIIAKINNDILGDPKTIIMSSVAILGKVSCVGVYKYEDIVKKCFYDWDNPSDMFFIRTGKNVAIITYYSKKTNTVYICCVLN